MKNKTSRFTIFLNMLIPAVFFSLLIMTQTAYSQVSGEGWITAVKPSPKVSKFSWPTTAAAQPVNKISSSQKKSAGVQVSALTTSAASTPVSIASSAQITELARGLRCDLKNIFDYVHNNISYVPYFASLKGSTLTLLDGSGNDMDQAALMIDVCRQCGMTAQYVMGSMTFSDINQLANWLGVDPSPSLIQNYFYLGANLAEINGDGSIKVPRVLVKVTVNTTSYYFDPALKAYQDINKVDLGSLIGYDRNDFLSSANAGATVGTDFVQNLNETNVKNKLNTYAANLISNIRSQYPNKEVKDIIGGRKIISTQLSVLPTTLPSNFTAQNTLDDIDSTLQTSINIQHAGINYTTDSRNIAGKRLTITYVGSDHHPELRLDGQLVASGSATTLGSTVNLVVSVNHPYEPWFADYGDQSGTFPLKSGYTYAIVTDFGDVNDKLLKVRQKILSTHKANGLADTSEDVLGESLNIMGLTWLKEVSLASKIIGQITDTRKINHHTIGIMAQENSYYVDIKLNYLAGVSIHDNVNDVNAFTNSLSPLRSAFEHGVLEQMMGSNVPGVSTIKILQTVNSQGLKVFYANSGNYGSVQSQLQNYSSSLLSTFQSLVNSGFTLILPQSGNVGINQWHGQGYVAKITINNTTSIVMKISGGLNGGYSSQPAQVSSNVVWTNTSYASPDVTQNISVQSYTARDPVDMTSGAFVHNHTDLALGMAAPFGVGLAKNYNSSSNLIKKDLGYGWTHSQDIRIVPISDGDPGLGERLPEDAAAMIADLFVVNDVLKNQDNINGWMVSALAHKWAVDQLIDNALSVNLGSQTLEYIKLPDGTYSAPEGVTTALIKNADGTYSLKERFGSQLDFNASNRVAVLKDVDGNQMQYTYTGDQLTKVQDAVGRYLTLFYTSGRLSSVTDSTGRSVSYGYDGNNNLTSFTDPEGKVWQFGYDSLHRMTILTNPLNITTATNIYDSLDRVMTQLTPRQNGLTATYNFYFTGWKNVEEDPFGRVTTYHIDEEGRTTGVENALGDKSTVAFDGRNHQVLVTDPRGYSTQITYDNRDNITGIKNALLKETINRYDAQFRLYETENPLHHISKFFYDSEHHLTQTTDAENNISALSYYPNGRTQTTTDARLNVTTLTYDSLGAPLTAKTGNHPVIQSTYDTLGRLTTLVDQEGATTQFVYDNRGLLLERTDPLAKKTNFTYDNAGRLITTKDRKNAIINYAYTPSDKIDTVTYPDASQVKYNYDIHDRLFSMVDPLGTTQYFYDNANRLSSLINPFNKTVGYNYDAAGNVTKIVYPDNKEVIYTYDKLNRLETVKNWLNQTTTYNYDDAGRLFQQLNFNGTVVNFGYDNAGRLKTLENKTALAGGSVISSYQYTLDGNGNRTKVVQYEPLLPNMPIGNMGFIYNLQKNRLQTAGSTTFGYDDEGQTATKNSDVYAFDFDHRLKTLSGSANITYKYDGSGNRLEANRNGVITRYIYDASGNLLAETDGSNVITRYYIHGAGLLATLTPAGQVYTYHYDGNANTIALTDSTKTVVNKYSYAPFGSILGQQEAIAQPFKYVGQYGIQAEPNGLYYMRARYYDPTVHRFISEDPSGFGGGDVNLYGYVRGNPTGFVDPSGEVPLPLVTGIIGGVAGAIGNAAVQVWDNDGINNFSLSNVGIAAGTGFAAGVAAPFVATSMAGSMALGAAANVVQYTVEHVVNHQQMSVTGVALSAAAGAAGGAIGGAVERGVGLKFAEDSPWLDQGIAKALNNIDAVQANTTGSNLARNGLGGFVSSITGGGSNSNQK